MGKVPQIYLSYAREDREATERVYRRLLDEGFKPWMDVEDIIPGQDWRRVIGKAIRESDFILIFLSKNSVNERGYIQREIRLGLEIFSEMLVSDIFVIPVRLEECEIPDEISSLFHHVDIFKEGGWERLLEAIKIGIQRRGGGAALSKSLEKEKVSELRESLEKEKPKSHLFIAMPFSQAMEDRFFYGIQRAADATGFACKRLDKESFTGDILQQIRIEIESSSAVVADLTGANPNVYLEVGFAWGKGIPTILILEEKHELHLDVRGQRCLMYSTIRSLEEKLTKEIQNLLRNGMI